MKSKEFNIKSLLICIVLCTCCPILFIACSGEVERCTISFVTNSDSNISSYNQVKGEYVSNNNLEKPIKAGYIWGGWFFDNNFNNSIGEGFPLDKDIILYARWGQEFNISFDARGGEPVESIKSKPFEPNILSDKKTTKRANKFLGWFYDETCENAYNQTNKITSDIILYAGWQDTIELTEDNMADYFTIETNVTNDQFTGQVLSYTIELKDTAYLESLLTTDEIEFTIAYGSYIGSTRVDCSVEITLSKKNGFYKTGTHRGSIYYVQVLMGSLTKYADVISVSGILSSKGTQFSINPYEKYEIIYVTNGGNEISPLVVDEYTYISGGDMPTPIHNNENFVFAGWFTDSNLTAPFSQSDKITVIENKTFYTKWIEVFDVDFISNGGSEVSGIKSNAFGKTTLPSVSPTKRGNRFLGWFYDEECLIKFDSSREITENIVLYAGWKDTFVLVGTISENPSTFFTITTTVVNSATEGTYLDYDIKLKDDIYLDSLSTTDEIELEIYYQVREGYTTTICSATAKITLLKSEGFNKAGVDYGNSKYIISGNYFDKIKEKNSGYAASTNINTSTTLEFISGVLSSE